MKTVLFIETVNYTMLKSIDLKVVPRIGDEICFYGIKTYKVVSVSHSIYDTQSSIRVFLKPMTSNEICYHENMLRKYSNR